MVKLRGPLKVHGGKFYLSPFIIDNFVKDYENYDYLELFCGGCSVFLNKKPSQSDLINDLDYGIYAILNLIKNRVELFVSILEKFEYSRETFEYHKEKLHSFDTVEVSFTEIDYAVSDFVVRRMSRGGLKQKFAWSDRLRGGQPGEINAWKTIIKLLPEISGKLSNVQIENKSAFDLIKKNNRENAFLYLDPPYLKSTRVSASVYEYEMTDKNHYDLLDLIKNFKGKVLISGYWSNLYSKELKDWNQKFIPVANHASQQKKKQHKLEYVWMNY